MGLDVVELVIAVEEHFAIAIDDVDASQVRTVGDLERLVARKLLPRDGEAFLTSFTFYRLRSALRQRFGVARAQVTPEASLGDLVPQQRRRDAWATLASTLAWTLPELRRNGTLAVAIPVFGLMLVPTAIVAGTLGIVSTATGWAIVLAALPAMWLAYRATDPLAVHLPPECSTVGQATGAILALNFGRIARDRQAWSDKDLWNSLQRTIVEQLRVKPEEVTREARLVEDLALD